MNFIRRIYILEETNRREKLDAMLLLEEMNRFFRSVSIDIYTLEKAIASGDVSTVRMLRRYFGAVAERTTPNEVRGLKKSTCTVLCDILDVYINEQIKKEV